MNQHLLLIGLTAGLLIAGAAQAGPIYIYSINLPAITDAGAENDSGGFTAYPFSWEGPLMYNAGAGTDCPTVCGPVLGTTINANYYFDGFTFTSDGTDAEAEVKFAEFSDSTKQIVFSFVESDSFWSTTGAGLSFPSVDGTPSFTFQGGSATNCSGCAIDISTVAAPEPGACILPGAFLGIVAVVAGRRRRQLKAIV